MLINTSCPKHHHSPHLQPPLEPPMQRLITTTLLASAPRWLPLLSPPHTRLFHINPSLQRLTRRKCVSKAHKIRGGTSKASKKLTELDILSRDDQLSNIMWWKEKVQRLKKPSSIQLVSRLKYSNILGLDQSLKNGSLKEGNLNMELLQFKARFPREVLLCRVGDFYEAVGFDACVLVEHAGLNPFGGLRSDSIPKAGCPVVNLRQTLDDLTCSGYSVCIVEEVQGPAQARSRKGRFISGHAHPGSPYVFGLAGADHDVEFPEPMPVIGISRSAKGYCMISVLETMKTFSEEDGLTEEAIVTKLRTCRCHHLFLHVSLRQCSSGTCRWGEYGEGGLLWSECNGRSFEWLDGDPVEDLFCKVRDIYGLEQNARFRNITISSEKRPQSLYLGTATQIGIIPTEGIPSLLKVLFPSDGGGLPTLYIRDLLLNPPPYTIASAIQESCMRMGSVTCPVPEFTCISAPKLVKLLESKEVNHIEFCRIKKVADQILHMHNNHELCPILNSLMGPTWIATGLRIELQLLVKECRYISCRIGEMISLDGETDQKISSFEHIPSEFFQDMEYSWKGRVKRAHAEEAFEEVDEAAKDLSKVIMEDFLPIISRVKSIVSPHGCAKGEISYAREHGAVWFKGKRFTPTVWAGTPGEMQIKRLRPATDSKGRKVGEEWFTTQNVEDALYRYIDATTKARNKVLEILRALSAEFQSKINVIIFSSTLHIIAKALFSHVSEGRRRKWVFPELVQFCKSEDQGSAELGKKLELIDLSPYWFDAVQGRATSNDILMQSLFLLTGPNGGGKSSLLRSVCAASLLGICGLMVPAEKARIPHFDAIMLHMKSYDSPSDGKSSFQIEMSEMRSIVSSATSRSLVLLDEICRGTETAKGTCIAGSIVEALDHLGCLGIVSTHLHGIFDLPLVTKRTEYKAMEIEVVDECIRPTWKLVDGICRESLAFETAKREGVSEKIIKRAKELYLETKVEEKGAGKGRQLIHSSLDSQPNGLATAFAYPGNTVAVWPSDTEMPLHTNALHNDVESAVTIICQKKLIELYKKKCIPELVEVTCVTVNAGEQPPPSTIGMSSVYVLFRPDKKLYIGQSDDIAGRLHAHRSKEGLQNLSFLYIIVPGKSVASELETLLINKLPLLGYQLVNKADGKHRNFGTSTLSAIQLVAGP